MTSVAGGEVAAVLEAAGPKAVDLLLRIEERLGSVTAEAQGPLSKFAAEAAGGGGKRLRPLLAVLAAGPEPADEEAVIRAGVAVELVHAATLVHDDILDASDVRRGAPTVVASGGREMAVAVGDWLFAAAFGVLVETGPDDVELLAVAGSDLARGELLQRADAWDLSVTRERYAERCRLKTARLFQAAATLGSRAGGIDPSGAENFAAGIGVAFQMLDDVLDVTGPVERTGKPRGTDLLDGTVNLPLIEALDLDPTLREIDLRSLDGAGAEALCDRVVGCGATDQVRTDALAMMAAAEDSASQLPGVSEQAFRLVARALVERVA